MDFINISNLTISAKHSIAQWTSSVFRISSHEARMPFLGINFRRVVIGIYFERDEVEESIFQEGGPFFCRPYKPQKNQQKLQRNFESHQEVLRKIFVVFQSGIYRESLISLFVFPNYRWNNFGAVSFSEPFDTKRRDLIEPRALDTRHKCILVSLFFLAQFDNWGRGKPEAQIGK